MICDKCGKEVPQSNDATLLDAIVTDSPGRILFYQSRHFLPTEDCEGSPSRAQYIKGQPRDKRGYTYQPEWEQKYRDAYEQLQKKCGK